MTKLRPMGYVLIAVILFIIALGFGTGSRAWERTGTGIAPNTMARLTACGFAIADGLTLIAGAIASLRNGPWPQKPGA